MNNPSLRDIQHAFASSIFDDRGSRSNRATSAPADLKQAVPAPAAVAVLAAEKFASEKEASRMAIPEILATGKQRFEIYRTSVVETYRQTLASLYPVTNRLVGDAFFAQAAMQFCYENASTSGDLNQYGETFPSFLESYCSTQNLDYLADVARIEWHWHKAFHARDSGSFDLTTLGTVDPADFGRIVFSIQAGYRSLQSPYPIDRIWEVNQPQHSDPEVVHLDIESRCLLIYRFGFEVRIAKVSRGMYTMADALKQEHQLSDATQAALEVEPELNIESALQWLVAEQIIIGFFLSEMQPDNNQTSL